MLSSVNNQTGEVEITSIKVDNSVEENRGSCWQDCLSNQFPVTKYESEGKLSVFQVGVPHEGYTIETQLKNDKMNGKSKIISNDDVVVAKLTFVDGVANGPCTLYDNSGFLYFEGLFVDGYRSGKGKEFGNKGNVIFDGYFKLGKRAKLYRVPEMKEYWKELDEKSNKVLSVSKRDEYGRKCGICYFYNEDNSIIRVSEWNEENETLYSGYYKLYDVVHNMWIEGLFENGILNGTCKMFDIKGNVIFDGFFENGVKRKLLKMDEMDGYWKELDENDDNKVLSVSKRDEYGRKIGICYFYNEDNSIIRVSEWNEGKEKCVIKQFYGNQMIEFKNGTKRYEGEYVNSLKCEYKRDGKGKEYDKNGKTMIYQGNYANGKRNGRGTSYHNREVKYDGEWINGVTKRSFYIWNGLILLVGLIIVIFLFMFNTFIGIAALIIFIMCCVLYYYYVKNRKQKTIQYDTKNEKSKKNPNDIKAFDIKCNRILPIVSPCFFVELIEIGDDCFGSVKTFKIEGLNRLKTIKIGNNSFTQVISTVNWDGNKVNNKSRSFHILNCESLESIQIGEWSFCDYAGLFELKNLPQLQSIQIGTVGRDSFNFYCSSFVIRGIELILNN